MRKKVYGITIANTPSGEIDKKVFILGKDYYFYGIAKGAQKSKKRFGLSIEPFSMSEFIVYEKNNDSIPIIESATLLFFERKIIETREYSLAFLMISEIIFKTLKSGTQSGMLFRLINSLISVDKPEGKAFNILLYFMFWFLKLEGVFFWNSKCSRCGKEFMKNSEIFLSLKTSEFLCERCKDNLSLRTPNEFFEFAELARKNTPKDFLLKDISNRRILIKFMFDVLSSYSQVEFKSLSFLNVVYL